MSLELGTEPGFKLEGPKFSIQRLKKKKRNINTRDKVALLALIY